MPKKNGFVTKEYLDETLDKRLTDQTQVILVAVGEIMDTKLTKLKEEVQKIKDFIKKKFKVEIKAI